MRPSHRQLLSGSAQISGGTLVSRLLGMVREILCAAFFGTGAAFDAFVVAFSLPHLFRRVVGEAMFERVLLPPFGRLRAAGREGDGRRSLARSFGVVCAVTALLSGVLYWGAPFLVRVLAPGLDAATLQTASGLTRLLVPFLGLVALATFAGAVLLCADRKLLYGIVPAVTNGALIVTLIALHQRFAIRALALAWIGGALAFVLVQLPAVWRLVTGLDRTPSGAGPTPRHGRREGGPFLSSSFFTQGVVIVDRAVASLVGGGAISSLFYGFRLIHVPFSILSLSLGRSLEPELSRLRGRRDSEGFGNLLLFGLELNLLVLAPATLFLMVFASESVSVLFQRGSFGAASVAATSLACFYYALTLLPMGWVGLLLRVYSALENYRVAVAASLVGAVLNVVLDLLLYRTPLAQGGIALASAIALSVQAALLLVALPRCGVQPRWRQLFGTLVRLGMALAVFTVVLFGLRALVGVHGGTFEKLLRLGLVAVPSFAVYGAIVVTLRRRAVAQGGPVLLTGGGTGGHVYPALAIHRILEQQGLATKTLFLGVRGRAEETIVPRFGIPLAFVSSAPFAGGSLLARLTSLAVVGRGSLEAIGHLLRFRPKLVVATGGYVAAPVIVAAFVLKPLLGLKILVHEQNLMPGVLNKVASLLADVVLVSFRESAYFLWSNRSVYTGYPVRDPYLAPTFDGEALRQQLSIPSSARVVLVTGGSQGSRSLNRALATAIGSFAGDGDTLLVHSIGLHRAADYDALADTVERLRETLGERFDPDRLTATDEHGRTFYRGHLYLHDLVDYQRVADLVVCRAGAGSLAEGLALGNAMLVVPKRGLPGDHQELNAIGLAERGAAEVLFEQRDPQSGIDRLDPEELAARLRALLGSPERCAELSQGARRLADAGFAQRLLETVRAVLARGDVDYIPEVVEPPFVRFQRQFDALVQHLDRAGPESLYHRLYTIKVEEYLRSSQPMVVNKGIKLAGALRRTDLYPWIAERYGGFKGFLRRNALTAFAKAERFQPCFAAVLGAGLGDGYFEARREAVYLFCRFYREILALEDRELEASIEQRILHFLDDRWESFEVRAAAIVASVRLLDEQRFLARAGRFAHATEIRYREALLEAVDFGLAEGLLVDRLHVRQLVDRVLITTSDFSPAFRIRERFHRVARRLENR